MEHPNYKIMDPYYTYILNSWLARLRTSPHTPTIGKHYKQTTSLEENSFAYLKSPFKTQTLPHKFLKISISLLITPLKRARAHTHRSMIQVRPRLLRLCTGRGTARVRTRSPPQQQQQYKRSYSSIKTEELTTSEFSSKNSTEMHYDDDDDHNTSELCGNRVMIVVDSSVEAKGALHWALSHTVQVQDTIILMHVLVTKKTSKQGTS